MSPSTRSALSPVCAGPSRRLGSRLPALVVLCATLLGSIGLQAAPNDDAWLDDWPEDDLAARIAAVNDGDLAFVSNETAADAHAHLNRIRLTDLSLTDGWVVLEQCHENLDAVPAVQILFRADGIRALTIDRTENIGRAWVEGHSVQLRDVGDHAELCIRAESRALQDLGDGLYRLRNGPYMRRFLDGYYPMRVALDIRYPAERLRLVGQSPASQPGFEVSDRGGDLSVDATFEGRLITCFDFCARDAADCTGTAPECSTTPAR